MPPLIISPDIRRALRLLCGKPLPASPILRTLIGDRTASERHARKIRRMAGRK